MFKKEKFYPGISLKCVFYQRTSKKQKQWNWNILLSFQVPSPKHFHMSKKKTILYSDSDWGREITQSHKFFEQALTTYNDESWRKAGVLGWKGRRNSDRKDGDEKERTAWTRELLVLICMGCNFLSSVSLATPRDTCLFILSMHNYIKVYDLGVLFKILP